jgi:hypothetical protein
MNQVLAPVTQILKRNSNEINTMMLGLVILFLFPVKHFVPYDIKENVESELKKIMQVPWIMALVSVLVLCVFYSGDVKMLALSLYIVHYLAIHQ